MATSRAQRPLRSVLYFAGDEPEEYEDGERWGSDAVMIDLEDPRDPFTDQARRVARGQVGEYLRALPPPSPTRPLFLVRVRGVSTGHTLGDLEAVLCDNLAGVLLPKASTPADVIKLDGLLTCLEVEKGMVIGSTLIYPLLETANAIRCAYDIATASERVTYMGGAVSRSGDLQQALGYRWTLEGRESLFLRSKVLLDARAAGIRYPISGMWVGRLDDLDGLRTFANELRDLGYFGMLLNNACRELVPCVHEVFTPSDAEVAQWQALVEREEAATRTGDRLLRGDQTLGEGDVVHGSQVSAARLQLEWAQALAVRDGRTLGTPAPS